MSLGSILSSLDEIDQHEIETSNEKVFVFDSGGNDDGGNGDHHTCKLVSYIELKAALNSVCNS